MHSCQRVLVPERQPNPTRSHLEKPPLDRARGKKRPFCPRPQPGGDKNCERRIWRLLGWRAAGRATVGRAGAAGGQAGRWRPAGPPASRERSGPLAAPACSAPASRSSSAVLHPLATPTVLLCTPSRPDYSTNLTIGWPGLLTSRPTTQPTSQPTNNRPTKQWFTRPGSRACRVSPAMQTATV